MAALTKLTCVVMSMLGGAACASSIFDSPWAHAVTAEALPIEEKGFVTIGNIPQWVTIDGADRRNPVVLFLHGGPGNPLSPYSRSLYGTWSKKFTIVQWDQRGAGRTFGRNPQSVDERLTLDLMVRDGVEVAEYLKRRLAADKILLVGGSWGSALGVHMAKVRPDLFHLYVGVGQLVGQQENQTATMRRLRTLAAAAVDQPTLDVIAALGPPPWSNPRNFGIMRRMTRRYEKKVVDPAPASWWIRDPAYATPAHEAEYEGGEDYSYMQFVGAHGNGLLAAVNLRRLGPRFDVPIYLVQGVEDLVTTPDVARSWYDVIEAPRKRYVLVQRAGHDPNASTLAAVHAILSQHAEAVSSRWSQ